MEETRESRGGKRSRLGVTHFFDGSLIVPGDIEIIGDRVSAIGLPPAAGSSGMACAGFIDLQINGFGGIDAAHASGAELQVMARSIAHTGVTGFLVSLITADTGATARAIDATGAAMRRIASPTSSDSTRGARILGVHLEGPCLSPAYAGAHPPSLLAAPDHARIESWLARGEVKMVTLAPELAGGREAVRILAENGVLVAMGHTGATAAQSHDYFDAGARALTHGFNAHRPLTSREPGPLGAALCREDVVVTLIADGVHVAEENLAIARRAAKGDLALVTDAMTATGLVDGSFRFGSLEVTVCAGRATLADGTLAGSVATMDHCVRTAAAVWGVESALAAATTVPAGLLGNGDLARITVGAPADIVVLDDRLEVMAVLIAGQPVA